MSPEAKWRKFRNRAIFATAIIATVGPPIAHWDTTRQVFSGTYGCDTNPALLGVPYDAEAIAGGGLVQKPSGEIVPNSATMKRFNAGAHWYVDQTIAGHRPRMVAILEGDSRPKAVEAEKTAFNSLVSQFSNGSVEVPDADYYINNSLLNTSRSVDDFAEQFHTRGLNKAALFSDRSHIPRLTLLTCARDVPASGFAAEDVIIAHEPDEMISLYNWDNTPAMRHRDTMEFWKRLTLPWFNHGEALTVAKQIYRAWHATSLYQWLQGNK
jgi:hypothetical protein